MIEEELPIITISVPYIPTTGVGGLPMPGVPEDFDSTITKFGRTYDLHEIQGARLVLIDDMWCEVGYVAIYLRSEINGS